MSAVSESFFSSAQVDAAVIAGIISLAGVAFNAWLAHRIHRKTAMLQKRASEADSYRKMIQDYLPDLTDCIHQIMACSRIYRHEIHERGETIRAQNYKDKAEKAAERLKEIRRKTMIPLWGVRDDIQYLAKLPSWLGHHRKNPEHLAVITKRAEAFVNELLDVIRTCYADGTPPSTKQCAEVRSKKNLLKQAIDTNTDTGTANIKEEDTDE